MASLNWRHFIPTTWQEIGPGKERAGAQDLADKLVALARAAGTQFSSVATDLTALTTRVTTAEADITALEAADVALDARLDTAETDINTLEAADTALDTRLDAVESELPNKMEWKGAYSAATAYAVNDVVGYNGVTYVAIQAATNKDPETETTYWTALPGTDGGSSTVYVPTRQTVLDGDMNSSGKAEWIVAGTGLAVDVISPLVAVTIAFAAGFDANGAVDYVGRISASPATAWTSLTADTTNHLYVDRNTSTGALTYGQITNYPIYQKKTPTAHPKQLATGGTALASSGTAANAFDQDHGINSEWVSTETGVGISGVSYIGYDFGAGNTQQITQVVWTKYANASNNVSSVKAQWSSDGAAWTDIQTTTLDTVQSSHEVIAIASYTAARYFRFIANANLAVGQAWRVPKLVLQGLPTDTHWFDTNGMKMYAWDGSAWGAVQRVFIGDAVTDATSVTAVYAYAYCGDFDSDWTPISTTSTTNEIVLEHAIGMAISQGVDVQAYFSSNGTDLDAMIPNDMMYVGATRSGFSFHRLSSPLTQYEDSRMYLRISVANSITYYGENKSSGWIRIRMRRNW